MHEILRGVNADGTFKTTAAASYPLAMCEAWANIDLSESSTVSESSSPHPPMHDVEFSALPRSL